MVSFCGRNFFSKDVLIRHYFGGIFMIGLEYIVKLYNGTYKKLAEKLDITPSTVTDWLSRRRPIPKAKLEALSKLFKLEAEYFQKELSKIEEIELRLDYLDRISRRQSDVVRSSLHTQAYYKTMAYFITES